MIRNFRSFVHTLKRTKTIIRWIIWASLCLYVCFIVLSHLPVVQKMMGREVAKALSEKLGTQVQVGQIDLGILNHIIVDDVLIYDQRDKEMLRAGRLAARIDLITLVKNKKIAISSAQIFGLKADFYKQTATSPANYQFALDSLASKDTTSHTPLDLHIQRLIVRNGSIRYNQQDIPPTRQRFNPKHIELNKLSAQLIINRLTDTGIDAEIKHLSFVESTGLTLKDLSLQAIIKKNQAKISGISISLPQSNIQINNISAVYRGKKRSPFNLLQLHAKINLAPSTLTPSDLASFLPALKNISEPIKLRAQADLTSGIVNLKDIYLSSPKKNLTLSAQGRIENISTLSKWDIHIKKFDISNLFIRLIFKTLQKNFPERLNNLGNIAFRGTAKCKNMHYRVNGELSTLAGKTSLDIFTGEDFFSVAAHTKHFDLGKVLGDNKFHYISMNAKISGKKDLSTLSAQGIMPQFDYQGYSYKNLYINGKYAKDCFDGKLSIEDPNGFLSFEGQVNHIKAFINKKQPLAAHCNLIARGLNLPALNLSQDLGGKLLNFDAAVDGAGSTLDDLTGKLNFHNVNVQDGKKKIQLNHLNITTHTSLLSKSLQINSDFGSAYISGSYQYENLHKDFIGILRYYLPALTPLIPNNLIFNSNNSYNFNIKLVNSDLLKQQFGIDIQTLSPIEVKGSINTRSQDIDLGLHMPDISFDNQHFGNTNATVHSADGTLHAHIITEKYGKNGRQVAIELSGIAHHNNISATTDINIDGKKKIYGGFNYEAQLFRSGGQLGVNLQFHPSEIVIDTVSLNVQPSDLTYTNKCLDINHFEVSNHNQHITINGQTTGSPSDSLLIQLKDIDVPYILDLVNFHSVDFDGIASGSLAVKSAFTNPIATGNLEVKDFKFNNGDMGTLFANVNYNNKEGKLHIDAKAKAAQDSYTDVKGYVDIKNSYINLPIYAHGTHLYFLKQFCGSFMDNIQATAQGWCKVVGPLSDVNIEGDMYASGNIDITTIGTTYNLRNCRVRIIPNEIIFERDSVLDRDGHIGIVTGGLHHQALRHLTYDISIEAQNLLAYDFPKKQGNNTFWGVVYGTGQCNIHGRSGEITMNIDATPNRNSYITYNASTNGAIDESSFIKWRDVTPDSVSEPTTALPKTNNGKASANFSSDLHLNFLINTTPDFTLGVLMDETTGDNIALNGTGGIRATYYNKGGFQMFGNYNVDYGTYNLTIQNIIKKQFVFQPGSVLSFGGDPFEAALNLKGVYNLKSVPLSDLSLGHSFTSNNIRVDCLLNIGGTAAAPSVSFGLELPSLSTDAQQMIHSLLNSEQDLNQQVLYLLAFGRFSPQGNNNAVQEGAAAQSQTSLAMQSLLSGTLSQQINTVLSNVVKNNNWNFGANIATGNEGFDNAEYEGTLSGSLLNNRLLFNGEFGYRDNVATNSSSFIGDFDIRYLLYPTGNLALRFYNHTNDRYFTRNSLTTQGIGLIIKKDFTTIWDLLGLKRKKQKK